MPTRAAEAELEALCATLITGPLAAWTGCITCADHPDAVDPADLGDRALFDDLLARFSRPYGGADRRAAASFWSQYYFSRVIVAVTALCLGGDRPLRLDTARVKVRFCPDTGTPLAIHLRQGGPARPGGALVRAFYEEHVAKVVGCVKRHSGLSARLLWENAGCYGMWILRELARTRPAAAPVAEALLTDLEWPRAGCATLPHLKRAALDGEAAVRRLCCLRYTLPGVDRCSGTCPLAEPARDMAFAAAARTSKRAASGAM